MAINPRWIKTIKALAKGEDNFGKFEWVEHSLEDLDKFNALALISLPKYQRKEYATDINKRYKKAYPVYKIGPMCITNRYIKHRTDVSGPCIWLIKDKYARRTEGKY